MYRIFCIAAMLFAITLNLQADEKETDAVVKGIVTNKSTGESVPFLTVIIKGTTIGTASNEEGVFKLGKLEPGNYVVRVQGVGYIPVEKRVELSAGQECELSFEVEEDILDIDQVIVSANRNKTNRSESPVILNAVTERIFNSNNAVNLSESLNFSPGLRIENNCSNCGYLQLRMNGMDGSYSQILINSKPLFTGLSSVYGLEQIPVNMIERVEVIRGGGSALFGGNAIAGTVNIITKDPIENSYEVGSHLGLMDMSTPDQSLTFNASLVSGSHRSGLSIFGMYRDKNYFDANNDGFSELTDLQNASFGLSAFFRPTDLDRISLDYHHQDEFRRGGNNFNQKPHFADIAEQLDHKIDGASLSWDRFSEDQLSKYSAYVSGRITDRESYFGADQDPEAYGETDNQVIAAGLMFHKDIPAKKTVAHDLNAGIEYAWEQLQDDKINSDGSPNTAIAHQISGVAGVYLQNEWKWDRMNFLLGVRGDYYNIQDRLNASGNAEGFVLSPRINFLYDLADGFQWRFSYAKGYRAPQLYDEDLHIEVSTAHRVLHRNSPDLDEETSHSISSSVDFNKKTQLGTFYLLAEGFYTRLLDPFVQTISAVENSSTVIYTRSNADAGAVVAGGNLEVKYSPSAVFYFQLGMTLQKSLYDDPQHWGELEESVSKEFIRTPSAYGYFLGEWSRKHFSVSSTLNYTGSMNIPHMGLNVVEGSGSDEEEAAIEDGDVLRWERMEKSPQFVDMGVKVSYDFHFKRFPILEVSAGMQNIFDSYQSSFDRGPYRDPGYVYGPMRPRTFVMSVKFKSHH